MAQALVAEAAATAPRALPPARLGLTTPGPGGAGPVRMSVLAPAAPLSQLVPVPPTAQPFLAEVAATSARQALTWTDARGPAGLVRALAAAVGGRDPGCRARQPQRNGENLGRRP
jgi:hypothetical protein